MVQEGQDSQQPIDRIRARHTQLRRSHTPCPHANKHEHTHARRQHRAAHTTQQKPQHRPANCGRRRTVKDVLAFPASLHSGQQPVSQVSERQQAASMAAKLRRASQRC